MSDDIIAMYEPPDQRPNRESRTGGSTGSTDVAPVQPLDSPGTCSGPAPQRTATSSSFVTGRSEVWSVAARVASELELLLAPDQPRVPVPVAKPVLLACVQAGILECNEPVSAAVHPDVRLIVATPPWNTHCPNDGPFNDGGCGTTAYSGGPG